ncbi:MAG: DUF4258 domain-containing protein [Thermoplasmatales archaeon]|jgi:aspartate/methionine/tyrosine aminotransferase|nr:DUF4258 domain-containing protein [Thermoplasmatales archaeon]
MIVIYSKHAERRMEERGISRTIVEAVIGNPDTEETQSNQKRAVKIVDGKAIIVIYRETDGLKFIITAFASSRTKRYVSES